MKEYFVVPSIGNSKTGKTIYSDKSNREVDRDWQGKRGKLLKGDVC